MIKVWLGADSAITALGCSTAELLAGIEAGRSGCGEIFDPALWGKPFVAGTVDRARVAEIAVQESAADRTFLERMFAATIGEVIARSGIDPAAPDTALVISSTKGNIELLTGDGPTDKRVFLGEMARRVAGQCGFSNRPIVISNACISGVSAMIVAARLIREGLYGNVVVAGGDTLTRFVLTGFEAFRSVSGSVCRPYDAARDGLTLGEGCAAVLLTADADKALAPRIEVAGGAISGDANHISGPSRTGDGLFFAIRDAMAEAAVTPAGIAFVNGHGTGTLFNDEMESKAFALAGLDAVPVNGLKPYFGHTLGAAGVVETIVSAHALRKGMVWGTPGFERTGTPHALDVSPSHRTTSAAVCLKTASGFGGSNAAIVLRRGEGKTITAGSEPAIRETASVEIIPDGRPFGEMIRERFKALESPDMKFYKMDDLAKLAYVATSELLSKVETGARPLKEKYPPDRTGIILANRSASLDTDTRHCRQTEHDDASPAVFVYTLPNVAAGEVSIRHKIQGESTFFIDTDAGRAEDYAKMLLKKGHLKAAICGWCELLGDDFAANIKLLETE